MQEHDEKPMNVFNDSRQSVAFNNSFSQSAEKPAKVLESWQRLGILVLHDNTFRAGWKEYQQKRFQQPGNPG